MIISAKEHWPKHRVCTQSFSLTKLQHFSWQLSWFFTIYGLLFTAVIAWCTLNNQA